MLNRTRFFPRTGRPVRGSNALLQGIGDYKHAAPSGAMRGVVSGIGAMRGAVSGLMESVFKAKGARQFAGHRTLTECVENNVFPQAAKGCGPMAEHFLAACEQSGLLQCRENKPDGISGLDSLSRF